MLEQESRRIAAFIAMLAHELRNPLAPITSAVALLEKMGDLNATTVRARDIIARQSRHLTRLVDDLLDMSRISSGKIHIDSKPVLLQSVITEALEMANPSIQIQSHAVTVESIPEPVWVNGDISRLTQIVSNLLHNAAKFTPQCGEIRIGLAVANDVATITVKDNGIGIDPARLPNLFNRFAQHESDTSKIFGGLGLGLSLAQELAHLQQANITASSTGVAGEGSLFTVQLPVIPAPGGSTAAASAVQTILVVDDNRDTANVVAMLLETMGYRCRTANSGREAIASITSNRPNAVLLDIGLPDIDGHAVAQHVIANMRNPPPMIAVTGYGQPHDREKSLQSGFHAHMTKPVEADKLEAMLKSLLAA
jgi:CheY-like chemotaxis protein